MTREEAGKVALAVGTVDGSCSSCVGDICKVLNGLALGWRFSLNREAADIEFKGSHTDDEDCGCWTYRALPVDYVEG